MIALVAASQGNDFLLLKKGDRTIQSFFAGSKINFVSASGAGVEAYIQSIQNDTLYLKQFITRAVPTQLGVYVLDTSFYYSRYHYNQIHAFGKTGRRFNWAGSGAALMGGGFLLTVASGVVYLTDKKRFSIELLGAAVVLTGVGYLLLKQKSDAMEDGRKYKLNYIKASASKQL